MAKNDATVQHNQQPIASYDRFGWYWQPADWLQQMSAEDALTATRQSLHLSAQQQALQAQAAADEQHAEAQRLAQQRLLDSLFD
ncbi:hypothetical protein [Idiomarina xiamenensis]|uniref:Uncharacterized protein n=1 Tax=Idiomarina xiamenensis 10-D-4 TaxID=740709 RepID=K2KCL3_9GAMM|nr:hypothetical protein [Idiomarina xiamenensis]EKE84412.1 hypothetical protein A10D4_05072 [Idiomarina xiamenensis 10-D-4]